MIELPVTSLKPILLGKRQLPLTFLKCEFELPFGGGNKVQRFIQWLDEHPQTKEVHLASDEGSHSFLIMNNILNNARYQHIKGIFWEKKNSTFIKYRENNRRVYSKNKNITIKKFTLQFFINWLRSANHQLYSLGGRVVTKQNPYEKTMEDCITQLHPFIILNQPIWHLIPLASGTMADAFISYFSQHQLHQHKVIGLLTGNKSFKNILKLKYMFSNKIHLLETQMPLWNHYVTLAKQVESTHQLLLDPIHTCHLWKFLQTMPNWISNQDLIVVWLTQPLINGNNFI